MTDWGSCAVVEKRTGFVSGGWVFRGTRVPLQTLFDNLASGATAEDFLRWFPGVTGDQIRAVLAHAASHLHTGGMEGARSVRNTNTDPVLASQEYQRLSRELWENQVYCKLLIEAASPLTEIWIGDDDGYFVQREVGVLDTNLVPGDYTVSFGLGTTTYPIRLSADVRYTEQDIRVCQSIPRPVSHIPPA